MDFSHLNPSKPGLTPTTRKPSTETNATSGSRRTDRHADRAVRTHTGCFSFLSHTHIVGLGRKKSKATKVVAKTTDIN